ncbi:MAG: hypothetical protein LBB16_01525 [Puniceicoccales bacterium]|jgi:hypothetical protein|nr:hypothetical protein [Puniceicoccales bacterium]
MSIQGNASYVDIQRAVQELGSKAIKGGSQQVNITVANEDYYLQATYNSKDRKVKYTVTTLDSRKAETADAASTREMHTHIFTEKLGFFGQRHTGNVIAGVAKKLHSNHSSLEGCVKERINHASNKEKTIRTSINGQIYKITTISKGHGTVCVTCRAFDKSGRTIANISFECANGKIDEEKKIVLAKFKKVASARVSEKNVQINAAILDRGIKDFEGIMANLNGSSPDVANAVKVLDKHRMKISMAYPATEPRNKDIGECVAHLTNLVNDINNNRITTKDAIVCLGKAMNDLKAAAIGQRINDLVGIVNDQKASPMDKQNARQELADIANKVLDSDNLEFVNAMAALSGNLMSLAIRYGISEPADEKVTSWLNDTSRALSVLAKGRHSELMKNSRIMLECFSNQNAGLGDRLLALQRLAILYKARFYDTTQLDKEIVKAAQDFAVNLSFLGIAAIHGQGEDFAQALKDELARKNLPTDGLLAIVQTKTSPRLIKTPEGGGVVEGQGSGTPSASKIHEFEINGLKVIVAEQNENASPPVPHICILDKDNNSVHADVMLRRITQSNDSRENKLAQLEKMARALGQISPTLVKLGEHSTSVSSRAACDAGMLAQNYTRPGMLAKEYAKYQQKLQGND